MEETATMGFPQRLIGIFFYPGRVFQSLREKPAVLAPIILIAIFAAASVPLLTPLNVKLAEEQILKRNPQATQEEIAQAQQMMTGTVARVAGIVGAVIFTPLVLMFYALLFRTIFNVGLSGDASFRSVLSIVAHANLVSLLGLVVIVPLSLYQGQVGAGLNFGVLVPFLEEDNFIFRILKNIDVFIGWWLCLLSIGLGILYRMTTARVAKVLFSLWAVWILIKAVLSPTLSQYIPGM